MGRPIELLNTSDLLELAAIEGAIARTIAMKEACLKWNAPATTIEYAESEIRRYWNEKQALLSKGVQPDNAYLEGKAALNERLWKHSIPISPITFRGGYSSPHWIRGDKRLLTWLLSDIA